MNTPDPTEGPRAVMAAETARIQGQAAVQKGLAGLLNAATLAVLALTVLAFLAVL